MKKFAKMAVAAAIAGMAVMTQAAPVLIDDFSVAGMVNPLQDLTSGDGGHHAGVTVLIDAQETVS